MLLHVRDDDRNALTTGLEGNDHGFTMINPDAGLFSQLLLHVGLASKRPRIFDFMLSAANGIVMVVRNGTQFSPGARYEHRYVRCQTVVTISAVYACGVNTA